MGLLTGKKALILGVANDRSIAWGIAKALKAQGASIALTYMNDAIHKRVEPLSQELGADFIALMDVSNDDHYPALKKTVEEKWGHFDILIHSLAFADKDDLSKPFLQTSRKGFLMACDISAYSLVGLCQHLEPIMNDGGSVVAMTYYGSQKVIKNYNVMGVAKAALEASTRYLAYDLGSRKIKVNCISAGPIKTLAASGISGFRSLLSQVEEIAPMKEGVSQDDVAGAAVYLTTSLSGGVTGQVLYVDSGLSILGGF
jgi:enoyl-[acyl-carrier protein] reductase I